MADNKVFTIIPNWNLKDDLFACIDSLLTQTGIDQEIIVVDNGSTDDSVDGLRQRYPEVHVLALEKNIGYAGALNHGIRSALENNARFVFLLNNDTLIPEDVLKGLTSVFETDQNIGVVSPKILYESDHKKIFALGDKRVSWFPLPIGYGYRKKDRPYYDRKMDFDYVTGCAMLVRMEVLQKVGLFDESYFMYFEDADFCYRVRQAGFRIICDGGSVIHHKASLSLKKDQVNSVYLRARNRVWFFRTHPHGPSPWLTSIAIALMAIYRILLYLLRGQRKFIKPYINGLQDGRKYPAPIPSYEKDRLVLL